MRIIQYKHNKKVKPIVGDVVCYYDFDQDKEKIGIVVELSIEDAEEEVISDNGKTIEYVLQEYVCYVIASSSGLYHTTDDDIYGFYRNQDSHQELTKSKSNNS